MRISEHDAVIVMARCGKKKLPYGIRTEKRGKAWVCTWAFEMQESSAKREGYDAQPVGGEIRLDENYPGCPHCNASGFVQCGACGKLSCFGLEQKSAVCPFCNNKMERFKEDSEFNTMKSSVF